jgi:hypothetical protein
MTDRAAFDEIWQWIEDTPRRRTPPPPAIRRGDLPPARHHLRGLWRQRRGRTDHPVRHRAARLPRREWARLSEGLVQRVEAINAFLDDIYGARRSSPKASSRPT